MESVNRVFVKRTRRGQVKTHVRQHYLRDDLPSGSPLLDPPDSDTRLSASATRYLLLDTNVVLHQIDLLERPALCDIIVLQTVLEEVQHNKVSVHKRLRSLINDERRRFHVFCNEFHRGTYTVREPGETPNDRNDRAIRRAGLWYQAQLEGAVEVCLLTDDAENLRLAREAGLPAQRVREFVQSLPEANELLDVLAQQVGEASNEQGGDVESRAAKKGRGAQRYRAHLPLSQITKEVVAGRLHQGKLRVNRHNSTQAFVSVSSIPGHGDVLVNGREALNRATEGDLVAVRLLPEAQWQTGG